MHFSGEELEIQLMLSSLNREIRLPFLLRAAGYKLQESRGRLAFMFSSPKFLPVAAVE